MDSAVIDRLLTGVELERTRKQPPSGFPVLADIPGGRYTDPEFQRLEGECLWKSAWLYAGHKDEFPEPGSYKLWQRTGSPILIVRDRDDHINAFYNTCRHRGGPIVRDAAGTVRSKLVCRYHGWTYDLSGKLVGVPDQQDFVGLDMACRSLVPVRCESFGNWIFVNEDSNAMSLSEYLGPIAEYFRSLPLETIRLIQQDTLEVSCNFKILQETFFEVYHLKATHRDTVDRFLDHRGTNIILWQQGHSLMLTPNRRRDWVDPSVKGMVEMDGATDIERYHNPSFHIFPNLVTPVAPSGLPFLLSWPRTDRTMLLDVIWFAPEWGDGPPSAMWEVRTENFNRILDEDLQFVTKMQESVGSDGFRGATLSYQERRIYHWHEELDRRIGAHRVPEQLRVPQLLDGWVKEGWR
jgi:phenylpropionate dioxygenase-like ring-hydroxylating dioxygenase large terminal subunit